MNIKNLPFDLKLITLTSHPDNRGEVMELWRDKWLPETGFVQENISISHYGVVRGLHFQRKYPQGKLISVLSGEICDIAVDIRPNSATFGKFHRQILSSQTPQLLWIPPHFAHGFAVFSETAVVLYKMSDYYHADDQATIRWDDKTLNIDWGITTPIVSDKDQNGIFWKDFLCEF